MLCKSFRIGNPCLQPSLPNVHCNSFLWLVKFSFLMVKVGYPLVICYIATENGPVEIVDLPIENGGSFHSYVVLCQSLQEGKSLFLLMKLWCNPAPEFCSNDSNPQHRNVNHGVFPGGLVIPQDFDRNSHRECDLHGIIANAGMLIHLQVILSLDV